jgi:hypothetical protein
MHPDLDSTQPNSGLSHLNLDETQSDFHWTQLNLDLAQLSLALEHPVQRQLAVSNV